MSPYAKADEKKKHFQKFVFLVRSRPGGVQTEPLLSAHPAATRPLLLSCLRKLQILIIIALPGSKAPSILAPRLPWDGPGWLQDAPRWPDSASPAGAGSVGSGRWLCLQLPCGRDPVGIPEKTRQETRKVNMNMNMNMNKHEPVCVWEGPLDIVRSPPKQI